LSTDTSSDVVVVTIDGPSGSGKGTVSVRVAAELGFALLDSGAVYRAAALRVIRQAVDLGSEAAICACIRAMETRFESTADGVRVVLDGEDVSAEIRNEETASVASQIAVMPSVRTALLQTQRNFRRAPGLVADGRDMGTVVFPDAEYKFFLTAAAAERAQRRYKQLNEKGMPVTMEGLLQEIERRDRRDSTRKVAPLVPAKDALVVDSTGIGINAVTALVLRHIRESRT